MKAIDSIRIALMMGDQGTMQLLEDMRDAPLTFPTTRGGNHPLWVLGHLTVVEGGVREVIFGEANPVGHWGELFAPGSEPKADASHYPPFEELLATYRKLRAQNLEVLERFGDEGLDTPTKSPTPGLEELQSTVGKTFLLVALHQLNHRGQLADARRAAGRQPMFTPGPPVS